MSEATNIATGETLKPINMETEEDLNKQRDICILKGPMTQIWEAAVQMVTRRIGPSTKCPTLNNRPYDMLHLRHIALGCNKS